MTSPWLTRAASRAPQPQDLARLCRALNDAGARYVLIGGFAVIAHGAGRFTKHIGLLINDSPENVSLVKRGLSVLAEGEAFVRFLREMADSGPLQPIYGITGKRDLDEERPSYRPAGGPGGSVADAAARAPGGSGDGRHRLSISDCGSTARQARSWQARADTERERILARAYHAELAFLTQALDGQ